MPFTRLVPDDSPTEDKKLDAQQLLQVAKNYRFENGRRFHGLADSKYVLPNDEEEQERMDLLSHVLMLVLGGDLFKSPLKREPKRILDIGTGTGLWVLDCADRYPKAEVIGIDISPIQPKCSWAPNVKFQVQDFDEDWKFERNSFDLVHGRMLAGSVSSWESLARRAFKVLKPGGWLEFLDAGDAFKCDDNTLPPDSDHILRRWVRLWDEASVKCGTPWLSSTADENIKKCLIRAGFVDVQEIHFKVANNPWPKDKRQKMIGHYTQVHWEDGAESLSIGLFTRHLGWTVEQVKEFVEKLVPAFGDKSIHSYLDVLLVYGRKPEDAK